MSEPALRLEDVDVAYDGVAVVRGVRLELAPGERHALLGVSGSGKTTILRAAAGFEPVAAGRIRIDGRVADDGRRWLPPEARRIGVVFQDYALFPHLDVRGNVSFARRRMPAREVEALLDRVGLAGYGARAVSDLSGGEQQRVALARALAQEPRLILFDEPFSNLNRELRRSLREATVEVLCERGIGALFVTHDAEEAFTVAERISVIHRGRLLQTGSPRQLYLTPRSLEVARSVGEADALPARPDGDGAVSCALGRVAVRGDAGAATTLIVRPEQLRLRGDGGTRARILARRWLGPVEELVLLLPGGARLRARTPPGAVPEDADETGVELDGPAACV